MTNEDITYLDCYYKDSKELLEDISEKLILKGYVKETFKEAIIKREEIYPTGIKTQNFCLAIPHTDAEHILKPGIAFVRLKDSCKFKEMCTNEELDVNMAFVLLVNQKEKQVELLTRLMDLFVKNEILEKIYKENDDKLIVDILNAEIN